MKRSQSGQNYLVYTVVEKARSGFFLFEKSRERITDCAGAAREGREGPRAARAVRLSTTRPLPYGLLRRYVVAGHCRAAGKRHGKTVGWEALHGPQTCKTRRAPEPAAAQSCPRVRPANAAVRTEPSEPWSRAAPEVTTWVGLGLGSNPNPNPNPSPSPKPTTTPTPNLNPNPNLVW